MPNYPGDAFVVSLQEEVGKTYAEAGQALDLANVVWAGRALFDIGAGMSPEASRVKHLGELRRVLGLPSIVAPVPPILRLKAEGRRLTDESGKPFRYRGLTSFRLLEQMVKGQEVTVEDTLRWCRDHDVRVVRVFAMCWNLFKLYPLEAAPRLRALLDLAAKYGVYVELVALVDTASFPNLDFKAQLDRCDLDHPALLLEGANEIDPLHPTQDPRIVEICKAWRPTNGALYAEGSTHDTQDESDSLAGGDYLTVHFSRADGDGGFRWVRHTKEGWNLSDKVDKFVVNDEPRRDDLTPAKHFAMGVLCRLCGLGDTFHYRDGLQSLPPQGAELAAFDARRQGWAALPTDFEGDFKNSMWTDGPVKTFDTSAVVRIYHSLGDRVGYSLLIGKTGDPRIEWQGGWQPSVSLYDAGGVQLYRIVR